MADGGVADKSTGKPARKKSQKRQRSAQIKTPLTREEFNEVSARATAAGLSYAAYSRAAMLGRAGQRSQRRLPVDAMLMRQALAQLGKVGSNMNQIAYQLNAHGAQGLTADFRQALREWGEIRDLMLEALGKNPQPRPVANAPKSKFQTPPGK